jgi:hypothetical protein
MSKYFRSLFSKQPPNPTNESDDEEDFNAREAILNNPYSPGEQALMQQNDWMRDERERLEREHRIRMDTAAAATRKREEDKLAAAAIRRQEEDERAAAAIRRQEEAAQEAAARRRQEDDERAAAAQASQMDRKRQETPETSKLQAFCDNNRAQYQHREWFKAIELFLKNLGDKTESQQKKAYYDLDIKLLQTIAAGEYIDFKTKKGQILNPKVGSTTTVITDETEKNAIHEAKRILNFDYVYIRRYITAGRKRKSLRKQKGRRAKTCRKQKRTKRVYRK